MKTDKIKNANRKALPKFLLVLVICMVIGGVAGYSSAKYGLYRMAGTMKDTGAFFGIHIAPWLMLALAVIVPVLCIPIYQSAKKMVAMWDGEDEDAMDSADRKLSAVIWLASAVLIVSYFLAAVSYSGGFATFDSKCNTIAFFISVAAFLGIMAETIIIVQKCVDTIQQINPEKKASVYDIKFQEWMTAMKPKEL